MELNANFVYIIKIILIKKNEPIKSRVTGNVEFFFSFCSIYHFYESIQCFTLDDILLCNIVYLFYIPQSVYLTYMSFVAIYLHSENFIWYSNCGLLKTLVYFPSKFPNWHIVLQT